MMTLEQTHLSADNARETELKESIRRFLRTRGVDCLGKIEITVQGRTVVLNGVVPDSESKRRCLHCCCHVAGVADVVDKLRLKKTNV